MLKKIEKIEKIQLPPQPPAMNFSFPQLTRPSRIVLQVKDVAHRFSEMMVFRDISCEIERGEKVALVAPNGVGKTTLFNLIIGKLLVQKGSITLGTNVIPAIFEQEQDHWLDTHRSIWENINHECPKASEQKMRALLGAFLFSGDDVHKKTQVLSGGEKSRVGLVRLLLQDANFLLLDEPTNHLDIMSKDILLSALKAYQGTLFFVSHDHHFINNLATGIIELQPQSATRYAGNYDAYRYALQAQTTIMTHEVPQRNTIPRESTKNKYRDVYKKAAVLERTIEKLEREKRTLEESFVNLSYGTPEFGKAQMHLQKITQELETLLAQWEALMSNL